MMEMIAGLTPNRGLPGPANVAAYILAALLVEQTLARLFYSSIRSLVKPDDV